MTAPAINLTSDMPLPREVQQQDTMRTMEYTDQHGRTFVAVASNKTLEPCGPLTPVGWHAPLPMMVPPTKYFTFHPARVGRTVIDYDRWITDIANAEREYGVWVLQVAKREFGAAALQKIESRDHGLQMLCGPSPQSSEFVKAMKAGNKWALGIARMDGTAYPRPAWADPHVDGWIHESTYDGGEVDVRADPTAYPDVDDDAEDIVARVAGADRYADLEDDADPSALAGFQPLAKKRRPPTKES